MHNPPKSRFIPPFIDGIENVEQYTPGGTLQYVSAILWTMDIIKSSINSGMEDHLLSGWRAIRGKETTGVKSSLQRQCVATSPFPALQERIIISNFGQSYVFSSPPPSYKSATAMNYESQEVHFDGYVGFEADIWNLGCTVFEIRAGFPLFELLSRSTMLLQIVQMLGRLPDPWWRAAEDRAVYFAEDGQITRKPHKHFHLKV